MKRNIVRLYFFSFFSMFFVSLPVWVPYFQGYGFSMRDVFVVQAIFAFSVAFFEIPTGYFGDLFGRKKTLIAGGVAYGLAFTWLSFARTFTEVVLFEIGAALAMSLISGADVALMYDSLEESSGREDRTRVLGNMQFSQLLSEAGGAVLGGALAGYSLALPFKVQSVVAWFPLIIALTLVENERQGMNKETHKDNFLLVFRHIFGELKTRRIFIQLVVWGLSTFFAVWILQKYWGETQVPIYAFGLLWASGNLAAALVSRQVAFLDRVLGRTKANILGCALPVLAYYGMALVPGYAGVAIGIAGIYLGRGIIQVIMREEFNHVIPNQFRATANSIQSFMFRLVFAILGPGLGMVIDREGSRTALLLVGIVFTVVFSFSFLGKKASCCD